ncbi:antibiotic biosynthesis monooxygenase [Mucilaginibacter rubeus]|uniref:Antibiotic biosynthesis monooxygenase n=1 Tax=Mucilaginibacter rubeus TaxID=2027860 RepID=A0AAE6JHM8_9SPHI|nr:MULTISPECIES: antibiotic biosynthesis monooxygenase [Mucilaginibacter]QEM05633.1 antibiotic biosynthesis monooxygenase [Mucilaginibacter rubeus]QEM18220.1 antibiotic biosynthesis monooxygenase [Mucilaginibacter gossypii]QTE45247.1 antibiotic biosynthesis monooxygenase [Mucilaginibacter rubeus]QTE51843.1 antibiotic biosynthesis monooxygenase [Mucilaginibacter rubeus]QTE56931.1 antibiotic biosynthesis monooxygenase [Mucilaginibacter rubeus]
MSLANPEGNTKVSPFRGDLEGLIAQTPQPPYYAVIFTSVRTGVEEGYGDMANEMVELARQQEGFLGVESARNNVGITVSYWQSVEAIKNWKANARHLFAQQQGRDKWYLNYKVRICRVEHDYAF